MRSVTLVGLIIINILTLLLVFLWIKRKIRYKAMVLLIIASLLIADILFLIGYSNILIILIPVFVVNIATIVQVMFPREHINSPRQMAKARDIVLIVALGIILILGAAVLIIALLVLVRH